MQMLIIICSMFISFTGFVNAQNPCKTPDGKDGTCISIQQCPPALKNLKNYSTLTSKEINDLKASQCAIVEKTPWVCCVEPTFKESDFPILGQCGTQFKNKIVGGEEAAPGEYPWLTLIEYSKTGARPRFLCGGTLINKDYVITAAHCVGSTKLLQAGWSPKSVRLGEHKVSTDPDCEDDSECSPPVVNVIIAEIIVHEKYVPNSSTQYNDIALLRLSQSVAFTSFVKPICLPFDSSVRGVRLDNVIMVVSGFGLTENLTSSDVKMKVEVNGTNWIECNNLYGRGLTTSQICAGGEEGKDSCRGDSGGPLMIDGKLTRGLPITYLAGIVSRGHRHCGTVGYPAIYTRVDEFLYWIRHHMKHF